MTLPDRMHRLAMASEPTFGVKAFPCPHCGAIAEQSWGEWTAGETTRNYRTMGIAYATCMVCSRRSWWLTEPAPQLLWPRPTPGVPPSPEMPEAPKALYEEARAIAADSPRAAVALLRVATEVLLREVVPGASGDLNAVVAQAVKNGLTPMAQQAMDALRIIGNDAVHDVQIVLDEANTASIYNSLCRLLNLVVEQLVTAPRQAEEMYNALPESKRAAIERRDRAQP